MADIRCPMCSEMNPETAVECSSCGARLIPLISDPTSPETPQEDLTTDQPTPSESSSEVPDWLERMRDEVDATAPDAAVLGEPTGEGDSLEWLDQLRAADSGDEEGPPEGEVPDWLEEITEEGAGTTELDEEVPDWLAKIRARKAAQPAQVEGDVGDDEWLNRLREEGDPEAIEPSTEDLEPEDVTPGLEELVPGPPLEEESEEDLIPEPEALEDGALGLGLPEPKGIDEAAEDLIEIPPPHSPDPVETGDGGERLPIGEDLPHVPALILDEVIDTTPTVVDDVDLESIELPDWLTELKPPSRETAEGDEPSPDLAPATLPSWLEAMRPVETFRSVVEIEPEEEQIVESAGPLAGLRGVLMAEPVVAMPRAATASTARLQVTERQYAQAELLHRLVEDEEREELVTGPQRLRLPIVRWVIGFVLLLAVMLPLSFPSLGVAGFAHPSVVPRELGPLMELIGDVPSERPVLVVFDYTPGYSGELDAVAGSLLDQLMGRGLQIVTLSTRPTGPPLAERLVARIGANHQYLNGDDYLHLGYLSGGPTAVQLFAVRPPESILTGFLLPETFEGGSGWDAPMLASVERLSDFGLVAVITAGTDSARTWAEQAHPWMGETPLVMVLSAGAEPLVRPYFEALQPQVDGILTGLPAALSYEILNGQVGDAQARWDAFGMGMLAMELILIAGGVYGVGVWLIRLRENGG